MQTPVELADNRHVYHVYAVRVPQRDDIQAALQQRDIQTGIHYPIPVHLQQSFSELGYIRGDLPITEKAAGQLLSLPMFPELSKNQVSEVCAALCEEVLRAR
jgi:dTDP-4-amino-4,6-dideoxygalactose transaminase